VVQTRRDQLQAYRFVTTRVQSALLHGEPDAPETPMRRIGVAMVSGIMVAVLVAVAFGLYGLLRPGGKEGWRQPGTLVVEKETGTRFVYIPDDGALHPVLNYASARLILNTAAISVKYFSRKSLAGAPRGLPRGIPGLPDSLPDSKGLVSGPWTVCSRPAADVTKPPGMTVSVRYAVAGQHVDNAHALLVKTRTNAYLIWNDHQLKITSDTAIDALHYDESMALQVADTWVNAIPAGPELRAVHLAAAGTPAPDVAGQRALIGQVFRVPGAGNAKPTYWVALQDGLASTTETDALLLLADADNSKAYGGNNGNFTDISSADLVGATRSSRQVITAGFPPSLPSQLSPQAAESQVACAAYSGTDGTSTDVTVSLAREVPGARPQTRLTVGLDAGQTADQVLLPPGTAAVVRSLPRGNQPSDGYYVVTDAGGLYPVPNADVLGVLGFGGVNATPVPSGILELIPRGPALDPATANTESPVQGNSVQIPLGPGQNNPQQGGGG
jgi:type VII secretion protein EccB